MDIVALFDCLQPYVPSTTWRQLSRIALALLVMTGRVTMLGISRWAGKGGSYRTVQRLFSTVIPWAILFWVFFRHHVYCPDDVYLAAGDEVVVTKAGKNTHGLDRFFASLYGKPVPGLAFFTMSLVSVQQRRAFPMRVEQVVRSDAEKAASKAKAAAKNPKAPTATGAPRAPERQHEHQQGSPHAHPRTCADQSHIGSLAAPDHHRARGDLSGARWPLWQPPRPAYGAAVQLAPHFQAAV